MARCERLLVAADHDGQRAVLRPGLAARYRSVEKGDAARAGRGVELARHLGRGGRVIDEGRAGAHALEGAVLARRHRAQVIVVADAAEDEVGAQRGRRRSFGRTPAAVLGHPRGGLGRAAVVDGDVVAALFEEVPGHGESHDAQADPRHPRHSICSVLPSEPSGLAPAAGRRTRKKAPDPFGAEAEEIKLFWGECSSCRGGSACRGERG